MGWGEKDKDKLRKMRYSVSKSLYMHQRSLLGLLLELTNLLVCTILPDFLFRGLLKLEASQDYRNILEPLTPSS